MKKVMADTVNGVFFVDDFDSDDGASIVDQDNFFESLHDLSEDALIAAEVDSDMEAKIKDAFGIHEYAGGKLAK